MPSDAHRMKAIFDTKESSGYDDDIARRYHFPNRYLQVAQAAVGDWIVYREPKRGGREGYIAVARLVGIEADPAKAGHSYGVLEDFLPFDAVVPLRRASGFYEVRLQQVENPSLRGVALQGKSVRSITDDEFGAIVRDGLSDTLSAANAVRLGLDAKHVDAATQVLVDASIEVQERVIAQILMNRPIRDAAFRRSVLNAYDNRCAVTGLRIVNGGGKAEAQAAHIVPVADGGLDVVQNGIALSGTVHWLFDRHLISLTDDYGLLVSHNKVPEDLRSLFSKQLDRIRLPAVKAAWPHLSFVRRHREWFTAS